MALLAGATAIGGCVVGPQYHVPTPAAVTFDNGDGLLHPTSAAITLWWKTFGDPVLDSLMDKALAANLDVRGAIGRVNAARALFRDASLDKFPRITSAAAYSRGDAQAPGISSQRSLVEQVEIGFDATWEIDLFGRVRHSIESVAAESEATSADLDDIKVTIVAEVARNYLQLRGAQARQTVAEENARTQRDTLRLTLLRMEVGTADPIDVESARANLGATEASVPILETVEAQSANRLAVLIGERPGFLDQELSASATAPPSRATPLPIGDAEDFLRRRPDVMAAERRLAAQTARTGVATADMFPRLRLTGFVGLLSGDSSRLFESDARAWSAGSTISWPALDLGGARERLRAQEAQGEISQANYERTVLRAIEDLQNALVAYRKRQTQLVSLASQLKASRRAADLAHIRYKEGSIDFLRVLEAERGRLDAEDAWTQTQTLANTDVVAIYKALGGV